MWAISTDGLIFLSVGHNRGTCNTIKKVFTFFLFWSHFKRFLFSIFFLLFLKNVGKVQSGKQINLKHFQNNSYETDL